MAKPVSQDLVSLALKQIGQVTFGQRDVNLYSGYEPEVTNFVNEFLTAHQDFEFVGPPHLADSQKQVCLDGPNTTFWKVSTSSDWKVTPTGLGTLDNIFPESAAYIRLNTQTTPHWALLLGFVEVGSAGTVSRIDLSNVNGKIRGRSSRPFQSRIGDLKVFPLKPGVQLGDRGQIRVQMEFESTVDVEIIPLAVHIVPFEITRSDYTTGAWVATV